MASERHVCPQCQRVNPEEATYCYYDGAVLVSTAVIGYGPVNVANLPFPRPFVFPSGRMCRTFNELAMAIVQEWQVARDLLQGGYLEPFLGGIGRADLALAARQAAQFPDPDRGLDRLLERLPCDKEVIKPAKLAAEPLQVNLGTLQIGQDHKFELHVYNQGMRLLYGRVAVVNVPWLALGDSPGVREKAFKCEREWVLSVQVVGSKLRASLKPQTGKIVIDSNGGKAEIIVNVQVPVKPFPEGVLQGAQTPRQLAERAFKQPDEAAIYFETGKVKQWYEANGWVYGVQGPPANGLAAVQQFLEACGWTTPPPVECDTSKVDLAGPLNGRLEFTVRVKTSVPKPVFAWAVSDQPWLVPGKAICSGKLATIPVSIPQIPAPSEGDQLRATLTVTSNGRAKFTIPVTVRVSGEVAPAPSLAGAAPVTASAQGTSPLQTQEFVEATTVLSGSEAGSPFAFGSETLSGLSGRRTRPSTEGVSLLEEEEVAAVPVRRQRSDNAWVHLVPLALLLTVLAVLIVVDIFRRPATTQASSVPLTVDPNVEKHELLDDTAYLHIRFNRNQGYRQRFGIVIPAKKPSEEKALTYMDRDSEGKLTNPGRTSNLCIRYDGQTFLFGRRGDGQPSVIHVKAHKDRKAAAQEDGYMPVSYIEPGEKQPTYRSVFVYSDESVRDPEGDPVGIRVTQEVSLRRSDVSRKYEVVLFRFLVENTGTKPHRVGLRYMLDTLIGTNDGVPFAIPGQDRLVEDRADFRGNDIPPFIQALEKPNLTDPGIVAHLMLRLPNPRYESPERVVIAAWPDRELGGKCNGAFTEWEPDFYPFNGKRPDSAVFIYWAEKEVHPGQRREMGFAYGLGKLSASSARTADTQLAMTVSGELRRKGTFTVTAYVVNPGRGQQVVLRLPESFQLLEGEPRRTVQAISGRYIPVSWRVQAPDRIGEFEITVELGQIKQSQKIRIAEKSFLD